MKQRIKEKIYFFGLKIIRRYVPETSWKHEYMKWRWWFICSDQYDTRFKPMFAKMVSEYKGKIPNRGILAKIDYWLCWIFLGAEPDDYFDYEFFRKGWMWRNHHITRQRLNYMDNIFNDNGNYKCTCLINKIEFYQRWSAYIKRKWCVPQEVTYDEFRELFSDDPRIIVKLAETDGGKGVYAVDINQTNIQSIYERLHSADKKIVAEEFVYQKGFLHDIYPLSLNPLRICTIRVADKVEVCYGFFTVGCNGDLIANDNVGGIVFPVDTITGKMGIGQGRMSNWHRTHPDTGVQVDGSYVPDWDKIKAFACEAHRLAPENVCLIGWDVCWSDGELSLVEGNCSPGFPELPNRHENQWKMMKGYIELFFQSK